MQQTIVHRFDFKRILGMLTIELAMLTSRIAQCNGSSFSLTLPFGKPHELFAQYDCTNRTCFKSDVIRIAPYVGTDILYCFHSCKILSKFLTCNDKNGMCWNEMNDKKKERTVNIDCERRMVKIKSRMSDHFNTYVKYMAGKLFDAARHKCTILFARTVKVQIKPMGQFNLKAYSHEIRSIIIRDVNDESAGQVVQCVRRNRVILFDAI